MGNECWRREEDLGCQFCQQENETIEHLRVCEKLDIEESRTMKELMCYDGRGVDWIRRLLRRRKNR